jgi:hypothetical protein
MSSPEIVLPEQRGTLHESVEDGLELAWIDRLASTLKALASWSTRKSFAADLD